MTHTPEELRVLGCLVEKELTTPEQYPLSVNALTVACNQKTNRDPIMSLDEQDVGRALDRLREAGLAHRSAEGGRVSRYAHNVGTKLGLDAEEVAVLDVLLLRGPQTAGEVRSRAERLHNFAELSGVEAVLQRLMEGDPPLVVRLERLPGRKEHRYAHLLGGPPSQEQAAAAAEAPLTVAADPSAGSGRAVDRVSRLEQEVAALRAEVAALRDEVSDLRTRRG